MRIKEKHAHRPQKIPYGWICKCSCGFVDSNPVHSKERCRDKFYLHMKSGDYIKKREVKKKIKERENGEGVKQKAIDAIRARRREKKRNIDYNKALRDL